MSDDIWHLLQCVANEQQTNGNDNALVNGNGTIINFILDKQAIKQQ